jgi:hypothetical protein
MSGHPDYADLFRRANVLHPAFTAPRDGTAIVGRDADGRCDLIRWRTGADLEENSEPYWARYDTDEEFEVVAWIPSPLSNEEILEMYE